MNTKDNMDVNGFIENIINQVQFKEAHDEIRSEYLSHLDESVETGMSYGLSKDAAVKEALLRMGESQEIGNKLNVIHRPKIDLTLLISSIALCLIGIFTLNTFNLSILQSIWMIVGLIFGAAFIYMKPSTVLKVSPYAYPLAIVLIFAAYWGGVTYEGQPYLNLLGLNIKIVDLSAVLFFIAIGGIFYTLPRKANYFSTVVTAMVILPMIYYAFAQAFFAAVLYFVTIIAMLISAKMNTRYLSFVTFAGIGSLFMGVNGAIVQLQNLPTFQQNEAHTDFIFNQMMLTYPYLGMIAIFLFGILVVRIALVSLELKNSFSRAMSVGCATMFIAATAWGILSNIGYAPMPSAGLNVPFLSYGGTLLAANLALMGIVIGANRRKMLSLN